jgi:aryl-alcohol dehydrogenase-like predicted oxidoreductase
MVPIPGTSSVGHLEENVAAAALELSEKEFVELERMGKWLRYTRKGRKWCRFVLRIISRRN